MKHFNRLGALMVTVFLTSPWACSVFNESAHSTLPGLSPTRAATVPIPVKAESHIPSAYGDWKGWRGNPQHTGFQSMPGKIDFPMVKGRYRLGGKLFPHQTVLCRLGSSSGDEVLIVALPGFLEAFTLDGKLRWAKRNGLELSLLGCWDLAGDGHTEILAGSSGLSEGRLYIFDSKDGELIWTSPPGPGQIGAVKVAEIDPSRGLELLWAPAASSVIRAYTFLKGPERPILLWEAQLRDYVSDPYSYSPLVVGDLDRDGQLEIVIGGARGQVPIIILDAATGNEKARYSLNPYVAGHESGGTGQLFQLKHVKGADQEEIIIVSDYGSGDQYMFQGVAICNITRQDSTRVLETRPVGAHYVQGSVTDLDGDGFPEVLVSKYDPTSRRHDLLLLDTIDLSIKAREPNAYLIAIQDLDHDGLPTIIAFSDVSSEQPPRFGKLVAYKYSGSTFQKTGWKPGIGSLATLPSRDFDKPRIDNSGNTALVVDANGDGLNEILVLYDRDHNGLADTLVATNRISGAMVAQYKAKRGLGISILAAKVDHNPLKTRIVLFSNDGMLLFLDGKLKVISKIPIGGYYRNDALNAHNFEVAIVADMDGDNRNEVLVADSRGRVVKLAEIYGESPLDFLKGNAIWDAGLNQELLAIPSARGGARLVVRGKNADRPSLGMIDSSGNLFWEHLFAGPNHDPLENAIPIGLNYGRFNDDEHFDVVVSAGGMNTFPRITYAIDGQTGKVLWTSKIGTYADGTFAVWDLNGDKFDDLVLNYNVWKGFLLSGLSGEQMSKAVVMPGYRNLGPLDYNGAPIILGAQGDDRVQILNGEDNAHLSLLSASLQSEEPYSYKVVTQWAVEQSMPDDERFSMPAVAPTKSGGWIAGVGSQKGSLKAYRGKDGVTAWEIWLWGGKIVGSSPKLPNLLSSVTAVDVNGDGKVEFVVGGADGWLYAVEAESGILIWSLDLGSPVGDPIAADVDNDGFSELLVPAADGYLYIIGPKS